MTPLLRQVARAYAGSHTPDQLSDICFIFPNKRSATFFLRYLDLEMACPHIEPEATTIGEFFASLSPLAEAPRFMQLSTLYDAYRTIAPDSAPDFDRFMFWGEILLADFADVDRYMVNSAELFSNIEELREINSTYLTDAQRDIIRRYWGEDAPGLNWQPHAEGDEAERFWTHINRPGTHDNSEKFVSLWRVLQPLYELFNKQLAADGYATSGHLFRNAATLLSTVGPDAIPHRASRYVFIGFNMLSTSEIMVFDSMRRTGIADFYWDVASPAFALEGNKAGALALRGAKMFPSLYPLEDTGEEPAFSSPEIEIIGVASGVGQAKMAAERLEQWQAAGYIGASTDDSTGTDTAVVLADETLLMPVLSHLPDSIATTNVTMGFPMKLTPVAAVMRSAVALQRRVRMVDGRPAFFYEDVVGILAQPIVRSVAPEATDSILREIEERRIFSLDAADLAARYPALAPIFRPLGRDGEASLDHSASYIESLIDLFSTYATEEERPVERRFLMAYRAALDELVAAFRHRKVTMRETTMASLLERAIATATVNFTGEPLRGVQIMGVLETRSLDFSNLIMMSMNETVYPRRHSRPSFIPEALRHAFGLPGKDIAESVFGYYFFRLLSRARRVVLLYDARTVGIEKVGEMSRYLAQLLYMFPDLQIKHRAASFPNLPSATRPSLSIAKTPEVMERLREFMRPGSGRNISASSLNSYINCPMQFYLESVEGLRFKSETESADFIDWSTYGQIVHEVAERIYKTLAAESGDSTIRPDAARTIAADRPMISRFVTAAVNRHYLHLSNGPEGGDRLDPLRGESKVLGGIVVDLMRRMLTVEADTFGEFVFEGAEVKLDGPVRLSPDLPPINVKQVIDRIDFAGPCGSMRFVDYKTGGDQLSAASIEAAFDRNADKRPKVLFQLMFYCLCYSELKSYSGPIQPYVYLIRTMFTDPLVPMTIGKQQIADYRDYIETFKENLTKTVNAIFDSTTPFEARVNDPAYDGHACTFCRFKAICSPPD
jgi:CRISPR/Cas system-associated exonuclease Cas4 (RecB family)